MRWFALLLLVSRSCGLSLNQRGPALALKGESTVALKEQLRREAAPTKNGVEAGARTLATVEAIVAELESRGDLDRFPPLDGSHELVFTTTTGASSGKLGPFVGDVTQTFIDERRFENAVAIGPLRVALTARREPLDQRTYRVTFEEMGFSLFGVDLMKRPISGGGTWKLRYVDEDIRIMDTPSLFVLARKPSSIPLVDVLSDPARFMDDDD